MLNLPLSFFLLFILHTAAACGGEDSFNKLFLKDLKPNMKKYVILALLALLLTDPLVSYTWDTSRKHFQ